MDIVKSTKILEEGIFVKSILFYTKKGRTFYIAYANENWRKKDQKSKIPVFISHQALYFFRFVFRIGSMSRKIQYDE